MSVEIPEELLYPTVEELKMRTASEMAKKRRRNRRVGKEERLAAKRQRDTVKLRAIASEYDVPRRAETINHLSSLFAPSKRPKFSLASVNAKPSTQQQPCAAASKPTMKVAVDRVHRNGVTTSLVPPKPEARKRGRPPKVNPL